jgi:hypothetical protein
LLDQSYLGWVLSHFGLMLVVLVVLVREVRILEL